MPRSIMPSTSAAECETSTTRPGMNGPRSLTLTVTDAVATLVTRRRVPNNGAVRGSQLAGLNCSHSRSSSHTCRSSAIPTEPSVVAAGLAAAGLAANGVCFLDAEATRRWCATDARRCGAACAGDACGLTPSDADRSVTVCWTQPASVVPASASTNNWTACLVAI